MSKSYLHSYLNQQRASRLFLVMIFLAGGALLTLAAFSTEIQSNSRATYDLLLLGYAILSLVFIWRFALSLRLFGYFDPFELPVFLTIMVFLFIGLSGRATFGDLSLLHPRLRGDYAYLNLALFYTVLGIASLWLGYALDLRRVISFKGPVSSEKLRSGEVELPKFPAVLTVYGVCLVMRLIRISSGSAIYLAEKGGTEVWGGWNQWLTYGDDAAILIISILAIQVYKGKASRLQSMTLYIMVMLEVFSTYIGGGKGPIVGIAIVIFCCSLYIKRSIPWKFMAILVVSLILVFPVNKLYRQDIARGQVKTDSLTTASEKIFKLFGETWFSRPLEENLEAGTNLIKERQASIIQNIAIVIYSTPNIIPYQDGREYYLLPFLIVVPRLFWPGKPTSRGAWFGIEYLGSPPTTRSSAACTLFGDFYMNFGLPGILLGMFALGIVYRLLYQGLRASSRESCIALYIALLMTATGYEMGLPGLLQGVLQKLALFYLITRIVYQRTPVKPSETIMTPPEGGKS